MIFSLLKSFHGRFKNEVHRMMIIATHLQLCHQVGAKCMCTRLTYQTNLPLMSPQFFHSSTDVRKALDLKSALIKAVTGDILSVYMIKGPVFKGSMHHMASLCA